MSSSPSHRQSTRIVIATMLLDLAAEAARDGDHVFAQFTNGVGALLLRPKPIAELRPEFDALCRAFLSAAKRECSHRRGAHR